MNKRADYIYELVGRIIEKMAKKKRSGESFWQLSTVIKDKEISKINVFSDSCDKKVWKGIEASKYIGKEYVFYCKNFFGTHYLIDWQELNHEKN